MKKIVEKNGRLTIDIDGKEIPTIAYMSYIPQNADYDGFHKIGYELYSGCIYVSDNPINEYAGSPKCFDEGIWKSRDIFDFSSLDRVLKVTLGEQPQGYLMLRININMPNWWREENPNELMKFQDGTTLMQSSFSKKWIEDIKVFFDRLKSYMDNSKYKEHVIAWQPAAMATEEWFSPTTWNENQPDFSECAKVGFQNWCKQKYVNIDVLNGAWATQYFKFEDIEIPTAEKREVRSREDIIENTGESVYVSDFYECLNNSYAQAIMQISRYIKELYHGDMLVGTFYGYIGQLPCTSGHNELKKLLECADIDYFASPFAYVNQRQTAEDWIYHSSMETCRQYKKVWFMEADVRTCLSRCLYETNPELFDRDEPRMRLPIWFGPKTEEESIWNIIRSYAKVICSGQSLWWFDMWGGWYKTQKMMSILGKMREESVMQMRESFVSKSEVAIVLDEMSSYALKNSYFTKVHYQQLVTMGNTGVPYDLLLKSCVNIDNLQKYKCIIYIAPYTLEKDEGLLQTLSQQGKTVVLTGRKYNIYGENIHNAPDSLSEAELREYFEKANVHIYSGKSALIYAMEGYVSITACADGEYVLHLDKECLLENVFEEESYFTTEQKVMLPLRKNQTLFFKIKDGV